jgi:hypothetical protein
MADLIASTDYAGLLGRLQKLESENRMMKRFGSLVLIAMSGLMLMGQTNKSRSLESDSLVIRDAAGKVRIELGTLEDHSPILRMFGGLDSKNASLMLNSGENGSGLSFFGRGVMMLGDGNPGPSLVLANGEGGTAVDAGHVQTYDSNKFSAVLGHAGVVDPKSGSTTQTSAASLVLFGKDGKVVWSVP